MAPANPELRELVREMNRSGIAGRFLEEGRTELTAEGEIFPAAVLPVLATSRAGVRRVFPMKWGFSLNRRTIINARAETAAERPLFRESWQKHRCVIPVSSYFEWEHDENQKATQKYELRKEEPGLMWLAGLYRMEEELPAFVTHPVLIGNSCTRLKAEKNIMRIRIRCICVVAVVCADKGNTGFTAY